jgi:predicted metalloprotease with PDZ domain
MFLLLLQLCAIAAFGQSLSSIKVNVDATDAPRSVLHTSMTIPVKPGPVTLFYPKWIPGEHSPAGPINDLVALKISAKGRTIPWRRDDVEMFAFHCEVPAEVNALEVSFDDVSQPATTMSARLARIKWNRVLLYPRGVNSDAIQVVASLKLPPGWKFATALPLAKEGRDEVQFKEVSLTELVDSPAIIGANFRKVSYPSLQEASYTRWT